MSSQTPTIDLKKPDGSDDFLIQDFDDNYDKIDAAIAALQAAVADAGVGDAATLNGHPDTYFYSADNPPPGGGGGTATEGWTSSGNMNLGLAKSVGYDYTLKKVVVPSGGGILLVQLVCEFGIPANAQQQFTVSTKVDGTTFSLPTTATMPYANASGNYIVPLNHAAAVTLTAGNHHVQFRVQVGTGSGAYNTFRHWKANAFVVAPGAVYV